MRKIIRFLLSVLVTLVLVVIVAIVVLPLVIDPNDFKDDFTKIVEEKTGRVLTISGDLGLSVFPWIAIDIPAASLSNAENFEADEFAAIEQAHARVKLLPLLRKEIEIGVVVLDGLVLNMEIAANGDTNWQDLVKADTGASTEAGETEKKEQTSEGFALNSLVVEGVDISDAHVQWDDRSTKAKYTLSPFSLKTSEISSGKPISLDMDLDLQSSQPAVKGKVTFDGVVDVDETFSRIHLNDIVLVLDLIGDSLPGGRLQSSLKTSAEVDLENETLSTSLLKLTVLDLDINGSLQGQSIKSEARQFSGDFQVATFSPVNILRTLGQIAPVTSDNKVLEKADLSTHLEFTSNSIQLSQISVHLDDSTIKGNVKVSNFVKPAINFDINLDQLDVDRYLPPTMEATANSTAVAQTTPADLPVDMLRGLNIKGGMTIGSLKAYKMRSQDIEMQLLAKNGKIQIYPARAKMYEGSYSGNIQLDVRSTPKLSMDENLSGIQVGGLLMDMMNKEILTGKTQAHIKLSGTGKSIDSIKQTLNGSMGFTFEEGAIKGINLIRMIRQAQLAIKGKDPKEKAEPDQTDFSVLEATATVNNGVVRSDDLLAKSPLLRIGGKGQVDLNKQTIDYLLTTTLVGSLEGQGGRDISDLKGLPIPVEITGSFAQPKYKLRLDEAIKRVAGEKIRKKVDEKIDRKKDELKEKLENKLNDKLKGLFK